MTPIEKVIMEVSDLRDFYQEIEKGLRQQMQQGKMTKKSAKGSKK